MISLFHGQMVKGGWGGAKAVQDWIEYLEVSTLTPSSRLPLILSVVLFFEVPVKVWVSGVPARCAAERIALQSAWNVLDQQELLEWDASSLTP